MTAVTGLCAAATASGALLLVTGWRARRPDALTRGLGELARTAAPGSALDRVLDRWSAWLGRERQAACLRVLDESVASHRRRQAGAVVAVLAAVGLVWLGQGVSPAAVGWGVVAVPAALVVVEQRLHARARQRRARLGRQVLHAGEHVALAVTAGVTVAEALGRAAVAAPAPLASWLARVHAEVRTGRTLAAALGDTERALAVGEFTAFTDTVLTSSERGVPLAQVLMAQVADARARARAEQLERAGRAEIAMLLPVVFLVLPSVVAVAVFPGAQVLGSI